MPSDQPPNSYSVRVPFALSLSKCGPIRRLLPNPFPPGLSVHIESANQLSYPFALSLSKCVPINRQPRIPFALSQSNFGPTRRHLPNPFTLSLSKCRPINRQPQVPFALSQSKCNRSDLLSRLPNPPRRRLSTVSPSFLAWSIWVPTVSLVSPCKMDLAGSCLHSMAGSRIPLLDRARPFS